MIKSLFRAVAKRFPLVALVSLALLFVIAPVVSAFAQEVSVTPDIAGLAHIFGLNGGVALMVVAVISFVASAICALTPTPNPLTPWGRVYQGIEWIALITRNTKETGYPPVDALHAAQLAVLAAAPAKATPVSQPKAAAPAPVAPVAAAPAA